MEPFEINNLLKKAGFPKTKDVARYLNRESSQISQVVNGHTKNPKIREDIADILGMPVSEIWPEAPQVEQTAA